MERAQANTQEVSEILKWLGCSTCSTSTHTRLGWHGVSQLQHTQNLSIDKNETSYELHISTETWGDIQVGFLSSCYCFTLYLFMARMAR